MFLTDGRLIFAYVIGIPLLILSNPFIFVMENAYGQFEPLTLKPGEKRDMILPVAETTGENYIHGWADASGNAASWVTPKHIDFGELGPSKYIERSYTIKVPENQTPGRYELIWAYSCETLYSDTKECARAQASIEITVIGCPDFTITFMPPASDPRGVIFEPNDRSSFDLQLTWAGEIPSQGNGLDVQYNVAASAEAEKPGEVGRSILPKFVPNPVTMHSNRLNDMMEVETRDAPAGTYPLVIEATTQDPETGLTCTARTTVLLIVSKSPPPTTTPPPTVAEEKYTGPNTLTAWRGDVQIMKAGSNTWKPASQGLSLEPGDTIMTGANGSAVLRLGDAIIALRPGAAFAIGNLAPPEFKLDIGDLWMKIKKKLKGEPEITTPNAVIGPRGTEFTVEVVADDSTTVMVLDGTISVQDLKSGYSMLVNANQRLVVPNTLGGLDEQALQQSITTFDPNTIDRWWLSLPEPQIGSVTPTSEPGGGGCLIATAAFGSELAPQVQFLRNFRDQRILSTVAGSSFMNVFNMWYYSFSPNIADAERGIPALQQTIKYAIYPLLGILTVAEKAYSILNGEVGAVTVGFVASSMIGFVYFWPIAYAIAKVRRRFSSNVLIYPVFLSLVAVIVGILILDPILLMISTSAFVVIVVGISAVLSSKLISKIIRK